MRILRQKDKRLVSAITEGGAERNKALETIYGRCFPAINSYVLKNNGNAEEAQDVFQEGMIAFYRNVLADKFKFDSSISSYVFSICRNIWLMKLRKNAKMIETSVERIEVRNDTDIVTNERLVNVVLDKLGADCKKLLIAFYYGKSSMEDLKEIFDLKSVQVAKTKKYRCMKSLMALVKEKGLTIENFVA